MSAAVTDKQLGQAIIQLVQDGQYPESEAVISAELPSSAFLGLLARLELAREDLKVEVREVSKNTAPDIDGWIAQATQLHADIEESRITARRIIKQSQEGIPTQERVEDASNKVALLKGELTFNGILVGILGNIQSIHKQLLSAQDAALGDQLAEAVDLLVVATEGILRPRGFESTRVVMVLKNKAEELRQTITGILNECWSTLVEYNHVKGHLRINSEVQRSSIITIETVITSMERLGLLKPKIDDLYNDFERLFLTPRLLFDSDKTVAAITVKGNTLRTSGRLAETTIEDTVFDLTRMTEYLSMHLPPKIAVPLSATVMPSLTAKLVSAWLDGSVPSTLEGIPRFQDVLALILNFTEDIKSFGWAGGSELTKWVQKAPQIWLTKRKQMSLDRVRIILSNGFGMTKSVEREETQTISRNDDVFAHDGGEDDWDAGWSDEEKHHADIESHSKSVEEEDISAWGLDEDTTGTQASIHEDEDDVDQAWGWGDDDEPVPAGSSDSKPTKRSVQKANGGEPKPAEKARQITLKETYTITAVPEAIQDIITQIVIDAESLAHPRYERSPVAPAATDLYTLPTLVLAMYRAIAPSVYGNDVSGNMYLYNDNMWLAEKLRLLSAKHTVKAGSSNPRVIGRLQTEPDIKALEVFAKRAYSKEMESQRTILGDLLDGAQGFANCTVHPFAAECETAVNSTVDRIREINSQWKGVLSRSALLQSLGSLLSTVINKFIFDIEDMSDISEPESQRLTAFCNSISNLEDLFLPEKAPGSAADAMPLTAVYAPSWLKFQYLSNILESSLVDIKYLWTEGELSLEFTVEELTDLIEALFADSEHRRRAIGEIRRSSSRR